MKNTQDHMEMVRIVKLMFAKHESEFWLMAHVKSVKITKKLHMMVKDVLNKHANQICILEKTESAMTVLCILDHLKQIKRVVLQTNVHR